MILQAMTPDTQIRWIDEQERVLDRAEAMLAAAAMRFAVVFEWADLAPMPLRDRSARGQVLDWRRWIELEREALDAKRALIRAGIPIPAVLIRGTEVEVEAVRQQSHDLLEACGAAEVGSLIALVLESPELRASFLWVVAWLVGATIALTPHAPDEAPLEAAGWRPPSLRPGCRGGPVRHLDPPRRASRPRRFE